jgi:prepilin peptidase CpaA
MIGSVLPAMLETMAAAALAAAAAIDVAERIIPNRLVLIVLGCGLALRLLTGQGVPWASLLGGLAVLLALGTLAAFDLVGWGDVKMIAAVTFMVPAARVAPLLFAIVMAGGALACVYLIWRRVARVPAKPQAARGGVLRRMLGRENARIVANEPMPYALAILAGAVYGLATE